ncbi:MAG TPA: hypothetical protein VG755_39625 [Nannocystaceae bacterium]|nr:hypothetical protein [Nannocystaceae bacterium]
MSFRLGDKLLLVISAGVPLACGDDGNVAPAEGSSSSSSSSDTAESSSATAFTTTTEPGTSSDTLTTTQADSTGTSESGGSSSSEDTSTGTTATTESTSSESESSSDSGFVPMHCPYGLLGEPGLPHTLFGNTFMETDELEGSCGGDGAPELGFLFTAPVADTYTFDTHGSQLHTVLYVLDGECGGSEIACNDEGDGHQSALAVDLAADQTVTIVVDGEDATGAPFNVRAQQGSLVCPIDDVGNTVPQSIVGDSSYSFNGNAGSCGGAGGSDAAYVFTAPATAVYSFDTFGSELDTRVYVRNGVCNGSEIACGHGGVLAPLNNGQQVTVVVDTSYAGGPFTLDIGALDGTCPDEDLGSTIPSTPSNSTAGGSNFSAGSCGGFGSNDYSYTFTAAEQGLYTFDTAGSDFETALYLRDGGCLGAEIACAVSTMGSGAQITQSLAAGQSIVITVDGDGAEGDFQLLVDFSPTSGDCCVSHNYVECQDPDIVDCVCNGMFMDTFCCVSQWDGICVNEAISCGAICP